MGKSYSELPDSTTSWIREQKLFFVSTAPLASSGHINCSPKGLDSFRILDDRPVAYQDLTGSGAKTIRNRKDNGGITIRFWDFEGPRKIVSLYEKGEVFRGGDVRLEILFHYFLHTGERA